MFCVCGRELTSTSASPWIQFITDYYGRIISGTCVHGIYFPSKDQYGEKEGGDINCLHDYGQLKWETGKEVW